MSGSYVVNYSSRTEGVFIASTTGAKYLALGNGVKETMFAEKIVAFVAPKVQGKIMVLEDSQGTVALVENSPSFEKSQHVDVRHNLVRGLVKANKI